MTFVPGDSAQILSSKSNIVVLSIFASNCDSAIDLTASIRQIEPSCALNSAFTLVIYFTRQCITALSSYDQSSHHITITNMMSCLHARGDSVISHFQLNC